MTNETIIVDDQPVELKDIKPLTILVHPGEADIQIPHRVEINPEGTVACARAMTQENWESLRVAELFVELWKKIWLDTPPPEKIAKASLGFLHTIGLIVMIVECVLAGKQPFIRLPETYLHPKQQYGLADMFSFFTKGGKP